MRNAYATEHLHTKKVEEEASIDPISDALGGLINESSVDHSRNFQSDDDIENADNPTVANEEEHLSSSEENRATRFSLTCAAIAQKERYERTKDMRDLYFAEAAIREAIKITLAPHPMRAELWHYLRVILGLKYENTNNDEDLDDALEANNNAIECTVHPEDLPKYLSNLSDLLGRRFEKRGDIADLRGAVIAAEEAVGRATPDDPNLATYEYNLGVSYNKRWRLQSPRNDNDLDRAIHYKRKAMNRLLRNQRDPSIISKGLAAALTERARLKESGNDLREAIRVLKRITRVGLSEEENQLSLRDPVD